MNTNTTKTRSLRNRRPSAALVISCLALFMAMAGSAFAAQTMIRSANIVDGTIRTVDLKDNSVTSPKVADATITAGDLATDSVTTDEIATDAVKSDEIATDAVTGTEIAASAVNNTELGINSVTQSKIALDAVGAAQIATSAVGAGELDLVIQRQSAAVPVAGGDHGTASVSCTGGEQLISGGGSPGNYGVEMTSSRPAGNTWIYNARNTNAGASTMTAYALCLAG